MRSSSTRSGGHGPAEVHATLLSSPKTPSRLAWCGRISRCDSRCRRSQASAVSLGGSASEPTTVSTCSKRTPLSSGSATFGRLAVPDAGEPSPRWGYHTSRSCESVTVARPRPQTGWSRCMERRLPPMTSPLTPQVLADPVALTRALVDIESVSGNEKEIADAVFAVLEPNERLTVERIGNTVIARTRLQREQRSEEHTSELQSLAYLVCRLLLEKKNKKRKKLYSIQ